MRTKSMLRWSPPLIQPRVVVQAVVRRCVARWGSGDFRCRGGGDAWRGRQCLVLGRRVDADDVMVGIMGHRCEVCVLGGGRHLSMVAWQVTRHCADRWCGGDGVDFAVVPAADSTSRCGTAVVCRRVARWGGDNFHCRRQFWCSVAARGGGGCHVGAVA